MVVVACDPLVLDQDLGVRCEFLELLCHDVAVPLEPVEYWWPSAVLLNIFQVVENPLPVFVNGCADPRRVLQDPFLAPNVPLSFVHDRPPDSGHLRLHNVSSEVGISYNPEHRRSTVSGEHPYQRTAEQASFRLEHQSQATRLRACYIDSQLDVHNPRHATPPGQLCSSADTLTDTLTDGRGRSLWTPVEAKVVNFLRK